MNYRPLVFTASAFGMVLVAGAVVAQAPLIGSTTDRLFYTLDDDHDGVIERDEARASPILSAYFAEADSNADDTIDRAEFAVFESNSGSGGGTPYGGYGGGAGGGAVAPGGAPTTGSGGTAGVPAGAPPPTSSGPAGTLTTPGLPAGTPPPTSSGTTAGTAGGTGGAAGGGTTGGTTGSTPAPGSAPGSLAPRP